MKTIYWKSAKDDYQISSTTIFLEEVDLSKQEVLNSYNPFDDGIIISKQEFEHLDNQLSQKQINIQKLKDIQEQRDILLQQSDILYIRALESRLTTAKLAPLKEYRQALRDITDQPNLNNITWPTLPQLDF